MRASLDEAIVQQLLKMVHDGFGRRPEAHPETGPGVAVVESDGIADVAPDDGSPLTTHDPT